MLKHQESKPYKRVFDTGTRRNKTKTWKYAEMQAGDTSCSLQKRDLGVLSISCKKLGGSVDVVNLLPKRGYGAYYTGGYWG